MNLWKTFPKFDTLAFASIAAFLLCVSGCVASVAQQAEQQNSKSQTPQNPPPSTPANAPALGSRLANSEQPAVKRHKVWTNDDVILLRTPADIYLMEKEEEEAAEAAAAAKEAVTQAAAETAKQSRIDIKLPDTVEESQQMIKDTENGIQEGTAVLDKMREELLNAPEEQRPEKQKEIDRVTADVETLRGNLKVLRDHVQALTVKPAQENPLPPPSGL